MKEMEEKLLYYQPLYENLTYEIYNRGNNNDILFYTEQNYSWFIHKFCSYILPYVDVFAYRLLPADFRMVIRIKDFKTLPENRQHLRKGKILLFNPCEILSELFRRFFMAYSKGISKQEKRTGSLFEKNFKRTLIPDIHSLAAIIKSVHLDPQLSSNSINFWQYKYSSYHELAGCDHTFINRKSVVELFGGINAMINFHEVHSNETEYKLEILNCCIV
jgi:putative transposase